MSWYTKPTPKPRNTVRAFEPPCSPTTSTLAQRGPLGVRQDAVLPDDEHPPQRDHHQDAQQAAQHGHEHHPRPFHLVAQQDQRGHRGADAEGDRLARRAGRLHHVILQDRRPTHAEGARQAPEDRDRQHSHRDRRRDRHPHLEEQVQRRRAEDDPQQRADDYRGERQLGRVLARRDIGPECGGFLRLGRPVRSSPGIVAVDMGPGAPASSWLKGKAMRCDGRDRMGRRSPAAPGAWHLARRRAAAGRIDPSSSASARCRPAG